MVRIVVYDTAQLAIIKRAAKKHQWFTAITLTATQLERHSYWAIKEYLEFRRVDTKLARLLLERLHLRNFAEYLRVMKVIDEKEYKTIMDINAERNNYVHRRGREKFKRGKEAQQAYDPLVKAAIGILEGKLGAKKLMVANHDWTHDWRDTGKNKFLPAA